MLYIKLTNLPVDRLVQLTHYYTFHFFFNVNLCDRWNDVMKTKYLAHSCKWYFSSLEPRIHIVLTCTNYAYDNSKKRK